MPLLDRRKFLIGLFGTAAVVAAGPIPAAIEALPEQVFKDFASALPPANEIYGNATGEYAYARLEYLIAPPWFKVIIPDGYRPLRAESDRIGAEAIAHMKGEA